MRIDGSAALITGASQGLGRALAHALARGGASVALVARGREALDSAVEEIRSLGGEAYGIADDVGDPRAGYRIAAQAASLAGPIDLLINAASTLGETPLPVLLDARAEDVEQVFQVNLLGPFRLIKATAGQMALRGGGLVLNVSSDAAVEAYPGWGAYGASKAALDHLTRIWAAELAPTGVQLISVDPGEMNTRMHAAAIPDADPSTLQEASVVAERILRLIEKSADLEPGLRVVAGEAAA